MNDEYLVGKMQGSAFFCPNGHIMIVEGHGSTQLSGKCNTKECEHYSIVYEIVLPATMLKVKKQA